MITADRQEPVSLETVPSAGVPSAILSRGLAGLDIVAVDVNTVSPPHDINNMTAFLAAHIMYEGLVLLCRRPS